MKKGQSQALKKEGLDVTLLDPWIAEHYREPEDILGKEGLLAQVDQGGGGAGAGGHN